MSAVLGKRLAAAGGRLAAKGFTYLWVLVAVALIGIGLTATAEVWSTKARRARLAQADWAGTQYAQAISSYYEFSPGMAKVYPQSFTDLLEDRRGPVVRRHLRALYRNPFDEAGQWAQVLGGDARIRGVKLVLPEGTAGGERVYVYVRQNGVDGGTASTR